MTDPEKKMKKYTTAVERRLDLPRNIKVRVMSDFISAITARRESGMTDTEIYAELGTPRQAAQTLNEQMKEYTYRKSPWRFVFLFAAVYGLWEIFCRIFARLLQYVLLIPMMHQTEAASIGIIGGADGPTAIFITTPEWTHWVVPLLMAAVGICGFLRLRRCKQK